MEGQRVGSGRRQWDAVVPQQFDEIWSAARMSSHIIMQLRARELPLLGGKPNRAPETDALPVWQRR